MDSPLFVSEHVKMKRGKKKGCASRKFKKMEMAPAVGWLFCILA